MNERHGPGCAVRSDTSRLMRPAATSSAPLTRSSQITSKTSAASAGPNNPVSVSVCRNDCTCRASRCHTGRSLRSNTAQRVPRSMLAISSRLRRCAVSRRPAGVAAAPPASVFSATARGLAERSDCNGFRPCAASRARSASVSANCGRADWRSSSSSSSPGCHGERCVSRRASVPATAPQLANVSARPRSRSNAWMRGKHMNACSERNSNSRRPCSASSQDCHAAGGSTTSSAWRSRHRRAATSSALGPTSRSRSSGGMQTKRTSSADASANRPLPASGDPITS